ncbi:MAG: hypothetical protein RL518_2012 [Pseudomonadota bacterium]
MPSDTKLVATYIADFFETEDPNRARELILTNNSSMDSNERWRRETPYLVDKISIALAPNATSVILDFGCGIGRLAKGLIERHSCQVIGVDISSSMRRMAQEYVQSELFRVMTPQGFDQESTAAPCVDQAYAVWVLQHAAHPYEEIKRIQRALKPGGTFYVVNAPKRCVPCDLGWVNDGIDIYSCITELGFRQTAREKMDLYPDNGDPNQAHWCVTYERL